MAKTDVHLYKMEEKTYYANDWNPNVNVGQMLSELNRQIGNVDLILCGELYAPIIIKQENKIHNFVGEHSDNILKTIPTDSYWYHLKEKETIIISSEGILDHVQKLKSAETGFQEQYSFREVARKLMEEKLKEHNKDMGIFSNDKGKTAVVILDSFYPEVFVEKSSFDYKL